MAKLQGLGQKLGAEVPAAEIAVSPAMIEAAVEVWLLSATTFSLSETFSAVYHAMRRVEMAEAATADREGLLS